MVAPPPTGIEPADIVPMMHVQQTAVVKRCMFEKDNFSEVHRCLCGHSAACAPV